MRRHLTISLILLALIVVSGPVATLAAPGARSTGADSGAISAATYAPDSEECAFLGRINTYRKGKGLGPLALSKTLGAAAEHHSVDMATNDYTSHTLADGTTWEGNIAAHGYPTSSARAENIAYGKASAADVFTQWKNSSGHNRNMVGAKFNAIGIGRAYGETTHYKWYWTTTFGSVVDDTVTCAGTSPTSVTYGFTGGGRTTGSTSSALACDGDKTTAWQTTTSSAPSSAYVWFDLGATKSVGKIQWLFAKTGSADQFKIQVSTDKSTWTTIATKGNATAGTWQSLAWSGKTRYIRFVFSNPNKDKVLGYLAEVKAMS